MRRKFSFDIPRLKVGPSKPDAKSRPSPPDSPQTPVPRSLRQLPTDLDAELRAACTQVVNSYLPSHEIWNEDTKPALDYAAIKGGLDAMLTGKQDFYEQPDFPSSMAIVEPGMYSYKPDVATQDLFKNETKDVLARSAMLRAEHFPAASQQRSMTVITHTESPQQSKPTSAQSNVSELKTEPFERARISARSDSVGTTGSTPYTDTTDGPRNASTGMTSAAITPARGSKRTSSQAVQVSTDSANVQKVDSANTEWMRARLEKHRKLMEEREKAQSKQKPSVDEVNHGLPAISSAAPEGVHIPGALARVPSRKPVHASRPENVPRDNTSRPPTSHEPRDGTSGRAGTTQQETRQTDEPDGRGRNRSRSKSRIGRVSRVASRTASRAASRAENATQNMFAHYFRPGSAQAPPAESRESIGPRSRAGSLTYHVKEYFRPSSAMDSRKPSIDIARGRADSTESFQSTVSHLDSASQQRWRPWRGKAQNNFSAPDYNRPDSATGFSGRQRADTNESTSSPKQKPVINLNRELPPLPSLDQWKPEEPEAVSPAAKSGSNLVAKVDRVDGVLSSPYPGTSGEQRTPRRETRSSPKPHKSFVDVQKSSTGIASNSVRTEDNPHNNSRDRQQRVEALRSTPMHAARQSPPSIRHVAATGGGRTHVASLSNSPSGMDSTGSTFYNANPSTEYNTPLGHSRTNSSQMGSARKHSMDEHNRFYDQRYRNVPKHYQSAPVVPALPKDKERRRWWLGKDKRPRNDSQIVVESDASAEAPIIRMY